MGGLIPGPLLYSLREAFVRRRSGIRFDIRMQKPENGCTGLVALSLPMDFVSRWKPKGHFAEPEISIGIER
jgi:hypothetical protein